MQCCGLPENVRLPLCKVCCLLKDVPEANHVGLAKSAADDLQPHWERLAFGAATLLEATRDHHCWQACT